MGEKLTIFLHDPPPPPHLAKLDFSSPPQGPPILLDEHFNTPPHTHTHLTVLLYVRYRFIRVMQRFNCILDFRSKCHWLEATPQPWCLISCLFYKEKKLSPIVSFHPVKQMISGDFPSQEQQQYVSCLNHDTESSLSSVYVGLQWLACDLPFCLCFFFVIEMHFSRSLPLCHCMWWS